MSDWFSPTSYLVKDGTIVRAVHLNNPLNALNVTFDKFPAPHANAPATKGFGEVFAIEEPTLDTHPATHGNVVKNTSKYATSGGSGGAYTLTTTPAQTSLVAGMEAIFKANHASPGASTLDWSGLGPVAIVMADGSALADGDIPQDSIVRVVYDGTSYQISASFSVAASASASAASASASSASASASSANQSAGIATTSMIQSGISATEAAASAASIAVNFKIIDIGDWDMDLTNGVSINHGLDSSKIRSIQVTIISDGGTLFALPSWGATDLNTLAGAILATTPTTVSIARTVGGYFDDTGFNQTSFNRGWIIIQYVD